jgi:hypothetical protein
MKEESPLLGGSGNGGGTSTLVLGVSSIPSTPASMKACNIAKPKMGDVLQSNPPNGVWVPWTGGKPLADWYSLEPSAMMAAHCRRTMHHFVLCGLDMITYLPDPSEPTVMESVIQSPNKFTKDYVFSKIVDHCNSYDSYDSLNDLAAKNFVLSSLSPDHERLVSKLLVTTKKVTFLHFWMIVVEDVCILSVERFHLLESKVRNRIPTNYPGQNLDAMARANMVDLIDLQQGGWYNVATGGLQMVMNFCTANSESFEYKTFAYEILQNYKKAI